MREEHSSVMSWRWHGSRAVCGESRPGRELRSCCPPASFRAGQAAGCVPAGRRRSHSYGEPCWYERAALPGSPAWGSSPISPGRRDVPRRVPHRAGGGCDGVRRRQRAHVTGRLRARHGDRNRPYRRDIKATRNLQEGRHTPAAKIFHGKKGELYQRYQGMEDQLAARGIVLDCVVLWNTVYIDAALNQLRTPGIFRARRRRRTPQSFYGKHINVHGKYSFTPVGPR
jgi:Tn3 transposase DDE domain